MKLFSKKTTFLLGSVIGSVIGLLFARESGKNLRAKLKTSQTPQKKFEALFQEYLKVGKIALKEVRESKTMQEVVKGGNEIIAELKQRVQSEGSSAVKFAHKKATEVVREVERQAGGLEKRAKRKVGKQIKRVKKPARKIIRKAKKVIRSSKPKRKTPRRVKRSRVSTRKNKSKMKLRALVFGIALATCSVALAASISISGIVFSSAAQEPLVKTEILVNGVSMLMTDLQGSFALSELQHNDVIRARKEGYVGMSTIISGADEDLSFHLAPVWELDSANQIYQDVPIYSWFEPAVRKLYEMQTLSASTQQDFRPGENLTRGELAVLAVRAAGFLPKISGEKHFCDIELTDDFASAVEFMYQHGWLSGYVSNSCKLGRVFRPQMAVNRAEAVKMALIAFDDLVRKAIDERSCVGADFTDVPDTAWFTPFVDQASCLKFINGYSDGSFRPANPVNRAEIAVILANALESLL